MVDTPAEQAPVAGAGEARKHYGGKTQAADKTYGYHYDARHEASLEAHIIQMIGKLGQIESGYVPGTVVGEMHSLVAEVKGFLNKWDVYSSYAEKCASYIQNYKAVDQFVMRQLYEDFVRWAKILGFRDPVTRMEDWERHFLGY